MKKIKLFSLAGLAMILFSFNQANAANDVFAKGDKAINFQVGFGTSWYLGGSYYNSSMPQISLSMDYALRDDWGPGIFGIGGFVGMHSYKYKWGGYDYGYKYNDFHFAGRATYHYQFINKLDTYAGAMLGLTVKTANEYGTWAGTTDASDAGVGVLTTVFAGVRYYVSDNFSIMSELCIYDVAFFNLGVSLKF